MWTDTILYTSSREQAKACRKNRIRDASERNLIQGMCKEAAHMLLLSAMDRILTDSGKQRGV